MINRTEILQTYITYFSTHLKPVANCHNKVRTAHKQESFHGIPRHILSMFDLWPPDDIGIDLWTCCIAGYLNPTGCNHRAYKIPGGYPIPRSNIDCIWDPRKTGDIHKLLYSEKN